jgi:hypothetical protein
MPKLNIETLIQQNNLENNLKNLLHLKSSQDGDIYKKKLKNEIEELKYELKQNETQLEKIIIETKNNKIIIDFYQKFQNLKDEFEKQIIDEKLTNILYDTFEQIIKDINDKRRKIKKLKEELYNEKLPSVKIIKIDNIIKNLLKNI